MHIICLVQQSYRNNETYDVTHKNTRRLNCWHETTSIYIIFLMSFISCDCNPVAYSCYIIHSVWHFPFLLFICHPPFFWSYLCWYFFSNFYHYSPSTTQVSSRHESDDLPNKSTPVANKTRNIRWAKKIMIGSCFVGTASLFPCIYYDILCILFLHLWHPTL